MATVKFYLRKPRTKDVIPNQEVSIYAVFTVDRTQRFEITIKEKIQPKYWNAKSQEVKSSCRGHQEINAYLEDFKYKLKTLNREHREMPFDKFKELVLTSENRNQKKTLFLAYEQFLKAYQSEKDSKTVAKYLTLEKHLIIFDSQQSINLDTLDYKFYDQFKTYLSLIPNPFYKKFRLIEVDGIWQMVEGDQGEQVCVFDDQIYAYFKQIKTFLNWSEKRGYKVHPSYKNWEIIKRVYPPISLTLAELEHLESFVFDNNTVSPFTRSSNLLRSIQAIDIARDYLVFECRTGQRISDIKRFNYKELSGDKWTFIPRKGNRLSSKPQNVYFHGFCENALSILEKHNYKMPEVSEQKINENIKTACKIAGINQETVIYRYAQNKRIRIIGPKYEFMSTHTGRKSFVTIGLQHMSPKSVKDLARMSWKTLAHYEGDSEEYTLKENLGKVPTKALMRKAQ